MSFKPTVSTDNGVTFNENNLAFATLQEAQFSAQELMSRWLLVTDWGTSESTQEVNASIVDGKLVMR